MVDAGVVSLNLCRQHPGRRGAGVLTIHSLRVSGITMKGDLYSQSRKSTIHQLRESLRDCIAECENLEGPARHLTVLNTPIPIPELNFQPFLRRLDRELVKWEEQLREKRQAKQKAVSLNRPNLDVQFLEGRIGVGKTTNYAIGGRDFVVDQRTWVFGTIALGSQARVKCLTGSRGELRAMRVEIGEEYSH